MNKVSSRSHLIFVIELAFTSSTLNKTLKSKLVLCDLAGSERTGKTGANGLVLTEAKNINKSLLTLGLVIKSLADKSSHTPYRDSKLTYILKDSLGGNSLTSLLIACSQSMDNIEVFCKIFNRKQSLLSDLGSRQK